MVRIPDRDAEGRPQRVPHISWDPLLVPQDGALARPEQDFAGTVLGAIQPGQECYFVHGYEAKPAGPQYRLADTAYGGRRVCAAAQKGRVIGFQFHPEKSGPVGLALLKSFLELCEN